MNKIRIMERNRLSKEITELLNQQVTNEAWNAEIYLAFGAWANEQGMSGFGDFLFRHAEEERTHMMKFMQHIMQRGGRVKINQIPAPLDDPKDLKACLEAIFDAEVKNSKSIYKIVDLALKEKDWPTWNFLQWFVKEQIEEENMADDLLDRYELITAGGTISGGDLYQFDKDLEVADDEFDIARDADIEG